MYLKLTDQNLKFANSLSLSLLSLECSFLFTLMHHANMVFSSFELEVVTTDFIEKNVIALAGIELEA